MAENKKKQTLPKTGRNLNLKNISVVHPSVLNDSQHSQTTSSFTSKETSESSPDEKVKHQKEINLEFKNAKHQNDQQRQNISTKQNLNVNHKDDTEDSSENLHRILKFTSSILAGCLIGFGLVYGGYRFTQLLGSENRSYGGSSQFGANSNNDNSVFNQNIGQASRVNLNSNNCGKLHSSVPNIHVKRDNFNKSLDQVGRIVGGASSNIGFYPWQVSLWVDNSHVCGGSIIASNWILFAAHCTTPYPYAGYWSVYAGTHNQEQVKSTAQYAKVTKVIVHSLYNEDTFDNDIALLKLDRDLAFNVNVNSICIPSTTQHLITNKICKISGWGSLYEGSSISRILQATSVKIIDKTICNSHNWLSGFVLETMFCAGSEDGKKDACQGDSGSALSCYSSISDKSFVVGVVSWGIGCGQPQTPGVYTHVGLYYSWVLHQISTN